MTDITEPGGIAAPRMFTLTRYTREAGRNRISVIQGFEVPLRKLILVLTGLGLSVVPTVFVAVLLGYWAVLVPIVFVGGLLFLVETRSRDGLRVPMWKAIQHRQQEPVDQFLCGGKPVDPLATGYYRIVPSSIPVYRDQPDMADLFAALPADPAGRSVHADRSGRFVDHTHTGRTLSPHRRLDRAGHAVARALRPARRVAERFSGRPATFFDLGE